MLSKKKNSQKMGKKGKIGLLIITVVFVFSVVSVLSILPKADNNMVNTNMAYDQSECKAQGHYTPKPLNDNQYYAPAEPIEDDSDNTLLAAQGHYKPKPLAPTEPDDPNGT